MKRVFALMLAAVSIAGCRKGHQASVAGAKEVLSPFAKSGADTTALTAGLRPKPEDYEAVFVGDAVQQAKTALEPMWDDTKGGIKPTAEQTQVEVEGMTPDQLGKLDGNTGACPGDYKGIADKLNPKIVVYCARFVKPGEKRGLSVDALVYVNDHWALFPKPFRALR